MSINNMDYYSSEISGLMSALAGDMMNLSDESEEYKDKQYLHALLDIVYGVTDLPGDPEERLKNLEVTKQLVENLEVME